MTSNTIESLNSQISKYAGKVTRWSASNMRGRWIAVLLMQIEIRTKQSSLNKGGSLILTNFDF